MTYQGYIKCGILPLNVPCLQTIIKLFTIVTIYYMIALDNHTSILYNSFFFSCGRGGGGSWGWGQGYRIEANLQININIEWLRNGLITS